MALFNKEPENNSRSENPHETPPVLVPSTSQSLVSENFDRHTTPLQRCAKSAL